MMYSLTFYDPHGPARLVEQSMPAAQGHDLLIAIDAVAVNPVDIKVQADLSENNSKVTGWDACGTVIEAGSECHHFKPGDKVYYAGDVSRDGCFASHQLVDERIAAKAPLLLSPSQSAALPLTSITAWELLFNRLKISLQKDAGKTLLIIGAAGGVGSILIQLSKHLAGLQVVATASRPESERWCRELGAYAVVSHHGDLKSNYQQADLPEPDYIICLSDSDKYFPIMAELIAPQGLIGLVVGCKNPVDLNLLKNKSAGVVWEFMFTRSLMKTADMQQQQLILQRIAELVDKGCLQSTLKHSYAELTAETLQQAHQQLSKGHSLGKIALGKLATP